MSDERGGLDAGTRSGGSCGGQCKNKNIFERPGCVLAAVE